MTDEHDNHQSAKQQHDTEPLIDDQDLLDKAEQIDPKNEVAKAITLFAEVVERDKALRSHDSKLMVKIGLLVPLVTFLGVILSIWFSAHLESRRELIQRNYQEAQSLQKELDEQGKISYEINKNINDIRAFRDFSHSLCKNGKYTGDKALLLRERRKRLFELVKVNFSVKQQFNIEIFDSIYHFIDLDDKDKKFCSNYSFSLDEKFRTLARVINEKINIDMIKKKEKIKKLKSSAGLNMKYK